MKGLLAVVAAAVVAKIMAPGIKARGRILVALVNMYPPPVEGDIDWDEVWRDLRHPPTAFYGR